MSVLDDTLAEHRKRIIAREEATFRELLRAYRGVEDELDRQIRELEKKVKAAVENGEKISPSWFAREKRLQTLLDQVKNQIVRFSQTAAPVIASEQRSAIDIAYSQANDVVSLTASRPLDLGSMLQTRTVENAVGFMGDGSPLMGYFTEQLAPAVAKRLRDEVIEATALGTPFSTVAGRLRQAGDITRYRALATARTEVNRVRRETTRQIYQENSDIVSGWEWVSSKSRRTCAACLALDGRIFGLDESFPQHVNCRCTMIPVIDRMPRPARTIGSEWFTRQSDAVKEEVIGTDGLATYNDGIVRLEDFVGWRNDKRFGKSIYTRPLSQILADQPIVERVIRTPKNIQLFFEDDVEDRITDIVGRTLTADQIGGMIGALDGSKIEVGEYEDGVIFRIVHPLIASQIRTLEQDWDGRAFIHNAYFRTSKTAPKGTGLKSFATQAMHAERYGISYIDTDAAGDYAASKSGAGRWNGYYTWPRLGYNAELTEEDWEKFPPTFRGISDLNELFMQKNGKFVWKYKGTGRDMIFDLDPNARSFRILKEYLQEKGFDIDFD